MKRIVIRFIITIMLAAVVQACTSVKPDPNTGPNTAQGQAPERMNGMLNPSPNQRALSYMK